MILKNKINPVVLHILRRIHKFGGGRYRNAIVAGGAIRDLYFNKDPKDYDLYLTEDLIKVDSSDSSYGNVYNHHHRDFISSLIGESDLSSKYSTVSIEKSIVSEVQNHPYDMINNIDIVWDVMVDGIVLQLIFIDIEPIKQVNEYFDFGLCRAYCDGQKLTYTSEFLTDANNKTLTLLEANLTQDHVDYILDTHLKRLKKKFPGYTTIIHPNNLQFINDNNKHLL